MRKSLATLALAALPAILLSACNGSGAGGAGVSALPNASTVSHQTKVRRGDNGPQDLHAGGADFPALAYNLEDQPVGTYNEPQAGPGRGSLFYAAPTTGTIYYCIANSGDGRKAFEGEGDSGFPPTGPCATLSATPTGFGGRMDPLDFVGTATALASTECCAAGTAYAKGRLTGSETWGQPFEIPQIGGAITFPFLASNFSVSSIKLSTWTYCAISNGTVSDWNDPAITADNGTSVTGGVSQPITFYFRSDSAGTTYNFTNSLNTQCNISFQAPYNKAPYGSPSRSAAWSFGVANTWPGPGSSGDPNSNFIGVFGAPNIVAGVQTTPFATGYLEGSYAHAASHPSLGQALLQNGYSKKKGAFFVDPTKHSTIVNALNSLTASSIVYGEGSDGNSLGSSTPWCQLYIPSNDFAAPPAKSYPIVGVSYLLFYGNNNGVHVPDKIALIKYLESTAANNLVKKFEYASFSSSVENAVITALNGTGSQAACLQ
jgi:ABC-type phosphate transport system substrate-binding protein